MAVRNGGRGEAGETPEVPLRRAASLPPPEVPLRRAGSLPPPEVPLRRAGSLPPHGGAPVLPVAAEVVRPPPRTSSAADSGAGRGGARGQMSGQTGQMAALAGQITRPGITRPGITRPGISWPASAGLRRNSAGSPRLESS